MLEWGGRIMKKTYYLFNPGRLQRRDNTLKFTPYDEDGNEQKPRFLPVENVGRIVLFWQSGSQFGFVQFSGTRANPHSFFRLP